MTPERYQRVVELFEAASDRGPDARPAFLARACAGDGDLRREVEAMLAADAQSGGFLDKPADDLAAAAVAARKARSLIGHKVSHYEVVSLLGAGGMGEVYRAKDTRLHREVAIKIADVSFSDRFGREARAVAALNHPNICTLHDVGPNYLVMELVEGHPIRGPLPLEKAVAYSVQILDALDAAHRKGIIHRDLKPANILVTKQGIKLLDFGLAKQTIPQGSGLTQELTGQGQIVGTLQYMSPEQLQGKAADARSDLFSFGCVLYEILTGKRAFEGESTASVIAAILERDPAPLEAAPPLDRVVRRSLAKDPDQRFQTARDLKAALTWALEQPLANSPTRLNRRSWWVALAATLVLGVLGGSWVVAHFRQPPADERVFRLEIDPPSGGRFVFGSTVGGIALSPDGRTAAYVASVNGKTALWVRPLDGRTARMLPGTEGAYYPFWSPDSASLGFFLGDKLLRIEMSGGTPLVICDVQAGRGGAWSSDGRILFGSVASGLLQVSASGGIPTPLTSLDVARGEGAHRWPQTLPGGRVLYWVRSSKRENQGMYAASLAKPSEHIRLLATDFNAVYARARDGRSYLLWLLGGTLVAQEFDPTTLKLTGDRQPVADTVGRVGPLGQMNVAASADGQLVYSSSNILSQFTWIDRIGKALAVVAEPGDYSTFRLSVDGRRVAAARDGPGRTDLWLLDAGRGISTRFTSDLAINTYPVWSPDGRTILFSSDRVLSLFRKDSGGAGNAERLTQSPNGQYTSDWSRDGRFVLYFEIAPGTQRDLWTLSLTPERRLAADVQPMPYLQTQFNESWGRFSPELNPRWITYQSDESGRYEIYVDTFPTPRNKTRISTNGGLYPQWGVGGREMFYVSLDNTLMAVSLKLGADSVEPSTPHELFPLPSVEIGWPPYDVAPDAQRFLVRAIPERQAAQPLTVIVNWPALLGKKAATP